MNNIFFLCQLLAKQSISSFMSIIGKTKVWLRIINMYLKICIVRLHINTAVFLLNITANLFLNPTKQKFAAALKTRDV